MEPPAPGYAYYPLAAGAYRVYEVREEAYFLDAPTQIRTYQLREVLTSGPVAAPGSSWRLQRYRRADPSAAWQPDSVGSVTLLNDQLLQTDANRSYVKLVFPVADQVRWNGNAYNSLGEDLYQFRYTGRSFSVLNQTFAETATVVQQNDSTRVNQDRRLEVYARNVGMIYREWIQLQFCSSTPSCVGKAQIDYGIRKYVRLQSYGTL